VIPEGPPGPTPIHRGPPADDPLAARLFPSLPGEVRWGLERTRRLLAALGDPLRNTPVLHVGGTNGKGSVAHVWAAILQAAGFRCGLYTSPELVSFRERILVDGRPLREAVLEDLAAELRPLLLRERPSAFEAHTALAFLAIERAGAEVAVVEVGLGGRLDATNVLTPVLTAITNVSVEHREILGESLVAIAREKAGILKPGVPAFTAAADPVVRETLVKEAAVSGTPLVRVGVPRGEISLDGVRFELPTRRWGRLELHSPLVGAHQVANVALAVRSLEALPPRIPVSAGAIREGVARARPPGRFQVEREGGRLWVLDTAHNPAAAEALAATVRQVGLPRPLIGVVGLLADKDHGGVLSPLAPVLDALVLTIPPRVHPSRRWSPEAARDGLGPGAGLPPVEVEPRAERAYERAGELAGESGSTLVAGSSLLVGDALRSLGRTPFQTLPPSSDFG
jgi:dihydrofolate synthase / folylpolyglutamate synthase